MRTALLAIRAERTLLVKRGGLWYDTSNRKGYLLSGIIL